MRDGTFSSSILFDCRIVSSTAVHGSRIGIAPGQWLPGNEFRTGGVPCSLRRLRCSCPFSSACWPRAWQTPPKRRGTWDLRPSHGAPSVSAPLSSSSVCLVRGCRLRLYLDLTLSCWLVDQQLLPVRRPSPLSTARTGPLPLFGRASDPWQGSTAAPGRSQSLLRLAPTLSINQSEAVNSITRVLLFSKINQTFFGYFDPENIFVDNENR